MSDAHAHDHDHPPFLQHHWENPKQQFEAGKLGGGHFRLEVSVGDASGEVSALGVAPLRVAAGS